MLCELKKTKYYWWCWEVPSGGLTSAETREEAIRNMVEIKRDAERQHLMEAAENWRYLARLACAGRTDAFQIRHGRRTGHADLDTWLMERFVHVGAFGVVSKLLAYKARSISNQAMELGDFVTGAGEVRWLNKRSEPAWSDYPELAERWEVDDEFAS